uniref:Uncharacterized protein n=1 Tax=Solanum lycopersicum TaxID=4081 RepID=A0A3Q7GZV8_SOLLC
MASTKNFHYLNGGDSLACGGNVRSLPAGYGGSDGVLHMQPTNTCPSSHLDSSAAVYTLDCKKHYLLCKIRQFKRMMVYISRPGINRRLQRKQAFKKLAVSRKSADLRRFLTETVFAAVNKRC